MPMASISRWTLAYFLVALSCLTLALGSMAMGFGFPGEGLLASSTLIVVHLVAIGWLSLLMLGALLQFLPVLTGRALRGASLAPVALGLLVCGLCMLLAGFAGIEGWWGLSAALLPWGGALLLAGFGLAVAMLATPLIGGKALPLPARFVALALFCLLGAASLGVLLAGMLAGLLGDDLAAALAERGVALHAGFGLGGWLSLAAMGVSYRLLSMFLLAPERRGWRPQLVLWSGAAGLTALLAALGLVLAGGEAAPAMLAAAGLAAGLAVALYIGDVAGLYRSRKRAVLELHMGAALPAFAALPLGLGLLLWAGFSGETELVAPVAVYILALGWLGGLGLAMLYKIVAFLTWLECFAPLMGRRPTPRVQDLVREDHAMVWFWLYFAGVAVAGAALWAQMPLVFRSGAGLQMLAVLALIQQFYRARRLADLPAEWRDLPRPRLFLPAPIERKMT